ncbi:MAG: DMT family transporter [Mobiluncus porci]|uniref:EamA/RhaT family transporter n=1 Tax=Mobiluncus porci TaxID=2652278 RepID=A0A7K0K0S0_9ACTO|nr:MULTISPECIES: DMT family transporter [Mobiluncus]MCI6583576.1 DMT family transporter [Mobiluncus sp.]MDD7541052.1 DMT family transporter [Mobiluncus porci]MDY5747512.1 DMT family transporter [Mobiluncus porci]MST49082.1 EamA/RhaT family transporter [Mobiluncus porci]
MHNIPLAIILQIFGSFCFALAARYQNSAIRREVRHNQSRHRLKSSQLLASLKNPRWWQGMGLMGISLACQITALFFAPVSVVQPVGLLAFPWSMILQARVAHRRISKNEISLVALTVVATGIFTAIVSIYATPESELTEWKVFVGALVIYLVAATFGGLGAKGPQYWRSLFWGSGGAMFYGLEAALVRTLINFARQHNWLDNPLFWGILACLIIGSLTAGWMIQQGYATGQAEMVVASMTITSPVVAVCYGIFVLGEGQNFTWGVALAVAACGLIAIAGVVALSHIKAHQPVIVDTSDIPQVSSTEKPA